MPFMDVGTRTKTTVDCPGTTVAIRQQQMLPTNGGGFGWRGRLRGHLGIRSNLNPVSDAH
jgi:hypothetical protein